MGKRYQLPPTKAESAEERLEEIVKNKSVLNYRLFLNNDNYYSIYIKDGECRAYPDGFEALDPEKGGALYIQRRNAVIYYDVRKDFEAREKR